MKSLAYLVWWLRLQRFGSFERVLHALATRGGGLSVRHICDNYGLGVVDYGRGLSRTHETLDIMEDGGLVKLDTRRGSPVYVLTQKGYRLACESQKRQPRRWNRLCELCAEKPE